MLSRMRCLDALLHVTAELTCDWQSNGRAECSAGWNDARRQRAQTDKMQRTEEKAEMRSWSGFERGMRRND